MSIVSAERASPWIRLLESQTTKLSLHPRLVLARYQMMSIVSAERASPSIKLLESQTTKLNLHARLVLARYQMSQTTDKILATNYDAETCTSDVKKQKTKQESSSTELRINLRQTTCGWIKRTLNETTWSEYLGVTLVVKCPDSFVCFYCV